MEQIFDSFNLGKLSERVGALESLGALAMLGREQTNKTNSTKWKPRAVVVRENIN